MDEIVYQCPECNFNTDNVTDLDGHMDEFHANLLNQLNDEGDDVDQGDYVNDQDIGEQLDHNDMYMEQEGDEDDMQNLEGYNEHELDYSGYNDYEDSTDPQQQLQQQPDLQHHMHMQQHLAQQQLYQSRSLNQQHNRQQQQQQQARVGGAASTPNGRKQPQQSQARNSQPKAVARKGASAAASAQSGSSQQQQQQQQQQPVINSDNHYERQYTCKRCGFFTNNPRAVLYHRRDFHGEKINVHECIYCQYASQYSGKVERHTLLRHKIHSNNTPKGKMNQMKGKAASQADESFNQSLNMTAMAGEASPAIMSRSLNVASAASASAEDQSSQPASPMNITKFQCNRCPCKYKRSNDLSKHLKMKHGEVAQRLSDYLVRIPVEGHWAKGMDGVESGEGASGHGTEDYSSLAADEASLLLHDQTQSQTMNDVSTLSQPGSRSNDSESSAAKQESSDGFSHGGAEQGSYECPYCSYCSQGNDAEYLAHVRDHLSGKSFRCVLCNSVYKYRGDCVVHLKRKHQKADMYAQNYVERFSLDSVDIGQVCVLLKPKQSEENENEEKLFGCAYCDYKANYKGDVFKHQTRRHPGCVKNVTALAQPTHQDQLNGSGLLNNSSLSAAAECSSPYGSQRSQSGPRGAVFQHNPNSLNTAASNRGGLHQRNAFQSPAQQQRFGQAHKQAINVKNVNSDKRYADTEHSPHGLDNSNSEHEQIFYNNSHVKERELDAYEGNNHEDYANENGEEFLYDDVDQEYEQQAGGGGGGGGESMFDETAYEDAPEYLEEELDAYQGHAQDEAHLHEQSYAGGQAKRASTILASVLNGNGAALLKARPGSSQSSLSSSSLHSSNLRQQQHQQQNLSEAVSSSYLANLKFLARRRSQHALRERKFKCPLCPRTSKWQWDIRKHMRTVHRGQDTEREVVILKEKELVKRLQAGPGHNSRLDLDQVKSKCAILNNRSFSVAAASEQQPDSYDDPSDSGSSSGSDPTGNKKFKCTACPYRSNLKADLFRHLRKLHAIQSPAPTHIIVLDPLVAAHTLNEYEASHGIPLQRKRTRTEPDDVNGSGASDLVYLSSGNEGGNSQQHQNKRDRLDMDASEHPSSCVVDELDARNQLQQEENWVELQHNNRLPVSIAELNIKPYKCLRCGFRSDRKSDTLRHIRVKHALANQAVKFLRIMSIKEASDSIEEYENLRLYKKIKNFKNGEPRRSDEMSAAANGSDRDTGLDEERSVCGSSAAWSDFASSKGSQPTRQAQLKSCRAADSQSPRADLYRCPFCSFKNHKKMVMRRHLVIHFSGAQAVRVTNPVYRCSLCTFRSKWQFFVKKHITTHHLSVKNAYVLRYPARSPSHKLTDQEAREARQQQNGDSDHNGNADDDSNGQHHNGCPPEDEHMDNGGSCDENGPDGGERQAASLKTEVSVKQEDEAAAAAAADDDEWAQQDAGQDENNRCNDVENNGMDLMLQAESSENSQETGGQARHGKQRESVTLTAHDGSTFEAAYYVLGSGDAKPTGQSAQPLSPVSNRRKAFFCAACPFQTKTFNNVKAHLANHSYMPDHVKCRYCVYYVSHGRLLRQHELLHPEFQELPEHAALKRSTSYSNNNNKSLVHA